MPNFFSLFLFSFKSFFCFSGTLWSSVVSWTNGFSLLLSRLFSVLRPSFWVVSYSDDYSRVPLYSCNFSCNFALSYSFVWFICLEKHLVGVSIRDIYLDSLLLSGPWSVCWEKSLFLTSCFIGPSLLSFEWSDSSSYSLLSSLCRISYWVWLLSINYTSSLCISESRETLDTRSSVWRLSCSFKETSYIWKLFWTNFPILSLSILSWFTF